ncbi:MAG: aldose 1-epimerase family protein [Dehalococcoidia bacterium]|nr:aldose 1-epimerase family protein [Dehalococcoidia bacterium]
MNASRYVELESPSLQARVDTHGAQLVSLAARVDGETRDLLWPGNPATWPDQAPVLFPVIGPLTDGLLRHGGETYPMPPHGFARLRDFDLVEKSGSRCVLELRDDDETRGQYPFAFVLSAAFELAGDRFTCTLSVENPGVEPLPADVGFHPGFNWPLEAGKTKEEYSAIFEKDEPAPIRRGVGDPVLLLPDGRPTPVKGKVLRLSDELFVDLPIVFDRLNSRSLVFGPDRGIGLRFDFPDSPNLGLWMLPGEPFLAVEPWQGYPSELDFHGPFVEKPGVAVIGPSERRSWRLSVRPISRS